MMKVSNFELEYQKLYETYEADQTEFITSGDDEYFRMYNFSNKYFENNKEVLYGRLYPLKVIRGIPKDDEHAEFYTYYTYAKRNNK